ncbi:MAG: NYN domain-containing protein [Anaerolineaceae bacterium]|nr:NYN domain-containing protein [Anaerolineaceae bacterium]
MINSTIRAALFIDFENLYTTLKNLHKQGVGDFGASPSIDFESLAEYVNQNAGNLTKDDTYAAANFSHYNKQLGGLNQFSQIINVDSFEPYQHHHSQKSSPGKKHVIHNYSDMALAFQAGLHAARNSADVYLFITGDGAFAAVADRLVLAGRQVQFILPDPGSANHILNERYLCIPFQETQPEKKPEPKILSASPVQEKAKPYQKGVKMIAEFRREFSTAIPANLIKAALGPSSANRLLDHARSEQAIDLWQSEAGVNCISLREERLYGKIVVMEPRPAFAQAAEILYVVAVIAESKKPPPTRADWRRALKEYLNLSSSESKYWLKLLLACGILQDSRLKQPDFTTTDIKTFLMNAETTQF